jgi:hypothetical protein
MLSESTFVGSQPLSDLQSAADGEIGGSSTNLIFQGKPMCSVLKRVDRLLFFPPGPPTSRDVASIPLPLQCRLLKLRNEIPGVLRHTFSFGTSPNISLTEKGLLNSPGDNTVLRFGCFVIVGLPVALTGKVPLA